MTRKKQIYQCTVCKNIVEVLRAGEGGLVCCQKPMDLLEEKKEDEGLEKHVPVIEETENGIKVKIGSVEHPMEENHYIEWIEAVVDGKYCRKFLGSEDRPEAEFNLKGENIEAREYCNVHGLWKP